MSEEAVRLTRSQKRALEKDVAAPAGPEEGECKKVKLEGGDLTVSPAPGGGGGGGGGGGDGDGGGGETDVVKMKTEQAAKVASLLKTGGGGGEVKATIKVEVQTGEQPVDMSSTAKSDIKKERQPVSPDYVIVLSDNEPSSPVTNGLNHSLKKTDTDRIMKSSPNERERIIKHLQEELRLQEAKLVLLKKLRQSQIQKESTVQKMTGSVATPPPLVRGSITSGKGPLQVSSGRSSGTVIPPPLVRGGQHIPSNKNPQIVMPPLVRGAQPIAVSPQQIQSFRLQHQQQQQQQQQHSGSGPPPLLLAPRASVPNVQVQGQRIIQQGLIRVANMQNTNVLVNISQASPNNLKGSSVTSQAGLSGGVSTVSAIESPAARQAAAKLALRKQLEKTLLEIPPPKPPAPELNFLPSAANNEFIYLVGLEEVVQNLLDTLGRGKTQALSAIAAAPKEPYTCTQCKTDFTSRWRPEKSGAIMCDHCMSSNNKKSLKAEHTNRLKAAFVKALQQEQEIEQRILQQAASASPVSKTPSSSSSVKSEQQHVLVSQQYKQIRASMQQQQQHHQQQQQHRGTPVARHLSTIKQSPGQLSRSVAMGVGSRGVTHQFSTSSQLQNAVNAAALLSRPGKQHAMRPVQGAKGSSSSSNAAAAAGAWRKQTAGTPGVAYVNPSLSVHNKSASAVERQREYLLDMIPSRSISQTANTWK